MSSQALRLFLCGIALPCAACVLVPSSAPAPRAVASAAPAAPVRPGYCREFQQSVTIGGVLQQAYGVSCQQADGSWRISDDGTAVPAPAPRAVAAPVPVPPVTVGGSYLMVPYAPASGDDETKPQK